MSETRTCAYCGRTFATIADHATHVIQTHDQGFIPRSEQRLRRRIICRACATELPTDASTCPCCGWSA